jgi:hypothetical protein
MSLNQRVKPSPSAAHAMALSESLNAAPCHENGNKHCSGRLAKRREPGQSDFALHDPAALGATREQSQGGLPMFGDKFPA